MFESFRRTEAQAYSQKRIIAHLLNCRKSKNARIVQNSKMAIISMCRQVVVKQVLNAINRYPTILEEDELFSECFVALDSCIRNYGRVGRVINRRDGEYDPNEFKYILKPKTKFYWYFNTAVNRRLERVCKKHPQPSSSEIPSDSKLEQAGVDLTYHDLRNMGLDDIEINLARYRVEGRTVQDFIDDFDDMNQDSYYRILSSVKQKILDNHE